MDKFFGFQLYSSTDTIGNLVTNIFGAFAVSAAGYFYIKNGKLVLISNLIAKFVEKNPKIFGSKKEDNGQGILNLIKEGENSKVEFKSTLRTNLHTNQLDKQIEHSVLKTIAAYLNSNGGTLLVGISDKGEILGLEKDNFISRDKANVHFNNLIKEHIGGEYLPFIKYQIVDFDGRSVLKVDCEKS